MTDKICFIITTMLRDDLLYKSAESLLPYIYQNPNWCMVIVDQGNLSSKKEEWLDKNKIDSLNYSRKNDQQQLFYYQVPFDSGLSFCRNFGVKKAKELDCEYCMISADSILFTSSILKINELISFFLSDKKLGKIGFNLKNRVGWEGWLSLIPNENFKLSFIDKSSFPLIKPYNAKFIECNICKNFYIAKTKCLLDVPYDEKLKLMEHEDHSFRFSKYTTLWTNLISGDYINHKPDEYNKYRKRMYNEFMQILLKKYNLKKWIEYEGLENAKKDMY